MGFIGVLGPVLFFLCLLPLALDSLPYELWLLYYYSLIRLVFLAFGSTVVWQALEMGPSSAASALCFALSVLSQAVLLLAVPPCHRSTAPTQVGMQFACLFFPIVHTAWRCVARGALVREALMHSLGLTMGALPPFVAAAYYYLLHLEGWRHSTPALALALLLWSLTPPLVKALGRPVWVRAAPAIPAMTQVTWIFYVELAFSSFGFLVFMARPVSAIAYALSLAPALLAQLLAGSRWAFRWMPYMGTLRLHRVELYLEAFAAVVGQIVAYTLFICFSILKLCQSSQSTVVVRARLFADQRVALPHSISVYGRRDVTEVALGLGFTGLLLISCTYAGFTLVVPTIWRPTAGTGPSTAAPPEVRGKSDDSDSVGGGANNRARPRQQDSASESTSSPCQGGGAGRPPPGQQGWASEGRGAPCRGGERGPGAVLGEGSLASGAGWLQDDGGTWSEALRQQHEVVLAFMREFKVYLLVAPVFVFSLSVLMVDFASRLHLDERAPCWRQA